MKQTAMVAGYTFAISVPDKDVPMTLFNLGDLVSDADDDDLSFEVSGKPVAYRLRPGHG